jgi:uncharacterized protein DUF2017
MALHSRVRRTRRGDFRLSLPQEERDILRSLPAELRRVLATDDPALARLFPPAYLDDPERNAEYHDLVREDLKAGRMESLRVMEATVDAERLSEEELAAWLAALNDLRLVLGSRLDVTQDMDLEDVAAHGPGAPAYGLYLYLGWLQEQVVGALSTNAS